METKTIYVLIKTIFFDERSERYVIGAFNSRDVAMMVLKNLVVDYESCGLKVWCGSQDNGLVEYIKDNGDVFHLEIKETVLY